MLTVTSPPDEIVKTINDEYKRATYWLIKNMGGEKKYKQKRGELLFKCRQTRETQSTPAIDWISQAGNRWMTFECATWYKEAQESFTVPVAFCYYETLGSVGAFLPMRRQFSDESIVIHFTNHFFLRFCQRLGIEMRSRWMVRRFLEIIPGIALQFYDERTSAGYQKVDARFPGSIGRGIVRQDGKLVELRTYLTDVQLNYKQKRETKKLRQSGDAQLFEPRSVMESRLYKSQDLASSLINEIDRFSNFGIDKDDVAMSLSIGIMIVRAFCELGYARPFDIEFWRHHGDAAARPVMRFVQLLKEQNGCTKNQLDDLLIEVAKADRIKDFDITECSRLVCKYWMEVSNTKKQKRNGI